MNFSYNIEFGDFMDTLYKKPSKLEIVEEKKKVNHLGL